MTENINQKLQEYETELETCRIQYNTILGRMKELETIPTIKEYKELQFDLSSLKRKYDRLSDEYVQFYQSNCNHPLWYFMDDISDRFEGRQRWKCKCIKCGIMEIGHSRNFKDKLIIESGNMGFGERCLSDYSIVRNDYLKLESSTEDEKVIVKTIIKKYNNQYKNNRDKK